MAKGRGHDRNKKKPNRGRADRRAPAAPAGTGGVVPASATMAPAPAASGVGATRGPVSAAYRAWVADFGRRQARAIDDEVAAGDGAPIPPDLFVLAPLTTRTVGTPGGATVSVQMGLPIVATRAGRAAVASDRLAIAALRLPETDPNSAMAMLGMGQAPDLPPPEALFAIQLPAEGLRAARLADAAAWYLARAAEAGDVEPDPEALAAAADEALTLLRPGAGPRGIGGGRSPALDPAVLDAYAGYGSDADEEAVPPDIQSAPARGGLPGLPSGAYLEDNGAPLVPLLADLRDYVIGLWPFDYFGLDALTSDPSADGPGRAAALAALSTVVRRLDETLAATTESEEAALAAEGRPPAWIATETAGLREARGALRSTRVAQEMARLLGPILFDLEIPPADYVPPGTGGDTDEDNEDGDIIDA